ncbi:MAG TPA: RNA polymerase sigma factor [Candidatus Aquilonibacter sp.]|nr:RNA polymerase sigma factor [Candidatus Aquilonibacter sp.]
MSTCIAAMPLIPEASKAKLKVDSELISRAKEGDQQACATIFDLHKRRVYSTCLLMTKNVCDAEDLMQDAFIQIFRGLNSFRGDSAFSTWIYRVVVNTVLMTRRKRRLREVSFDEPACLDYAPVPREFGSDDNELIGTVDRVALAQAAEELPEGCRKIFLMHEVEGYDHHEIAEQLRCSIGNSKSQLHKARLKLRKLLARSRKRIRRKRTMDRPEQKVSRSLGLRPLVPVTS